MNPHALLVALRNTTSEDAKSAALSVQFVLNTASAIAVGGTIDASVIGANTTAQSRQLASTLATLAKMITTAADAVDSATKGAKP